MVSFNTLIWLLVFHVENVELVYVFDREFRSIDPLSIEHLELSECTYDEGCWRESFNVIVYFVSPLILLWHG